MPGTKFKQLKDKNPDTEMYLSKVSKVESGNNPNAKNPNGSATGLFQFTESTWKGLNDKYKLGYTLDDRKNPEKAANMMRLFTQENEKQLQPVLGRDINDVDRYMGHFLGSGGAKKFFTAYNANPNIPISTVVSPDALKANRGVFYNKDGSLKTVGGVYDWASKKMDIKVEPKVYSSTSEVPTKMYTEQYIPPSNPANLQTSTTPYVEPTEETTQVQQAKQEINEKSFVQDLSELLSQQPQAQEEQQPEIQLDQSAYNYINEEEY